MSDRVFGQIADRLEALGDRLEYMEKFDRNSVGYAEVALESATPTDAELDSAFGTPGSDKYVDGFMGVIYDTANSVSHFVWIANTAWYYETGTLAV